MASSELLELCIEFRLLTRSMSSKTISRRSRYGILCAVRFDFVLYLYDLVVILAKLGVITWPRRLFLHTSVNKKSHNLTPV